MDISHKMIFELELELQYDALGVSICSDKPNKLTEPNWTDRFNSAREESLVWFGSFPNFVEIGKPNRTEHSLPHNFDFVP